MKDVEGTRWEGAASALRARCGGLAAGLFGLVYFVFLTDLRVLDVRAVDVVAAGDVAYHALARDFAQWDDWHWPLTRIDNYLWPVGTSAVFTDANPWLTLVTKLLIPKNAPPLQFIGPWLALCCALQGWCGARVAGLVTRDQAARALAGALFVVAPVLAHRLAHDTLAAHWIILALLEPALRPAGDPRASWRALAQSAALLTFAAGLHPTLFAMSLPIVLVTAVRHGRPLSRSRGALLAAMLVGPAAVWVTFGSVGPRVQRGATGFGHFSANLLSLFDPYDAMRSVVLPPLPHGAGQYEGFGYLGIGAIALACFGTFLAWRRPRAGGAGEKRVDRVWLAVAAAALVSATFAFSSRIMLGRWLVVDLSTLYRPLQAATDAFRSSGRFIWPLHYVVVAFGVVQAARLPALYARGALAVALGLQLVDARHVDARGVFTLGATPEAQSAAWQLAGADYSYLVLDPAQVETNVDVCPEGHLPLGSFVPFAQIARRAHLAFNSGQAARLDEPAMRAYCLELERARRAGTFDPLAIYVHLSAPPAGDESIPGQSHAAMTCRTLDRARVCVRADRATAFERVLGSQRGPEVPLDDASGVVTFETGFGPVVAEPTHPFRPSTARASLALGRPGPGPAILGFVGVGLPVSGTRVHVQIDGHEVPEPLLRNGKVVGSFTVADPSEVTRVTFDAEVPWQLVRLEWFSAR